MPQGMNEARDKEWLVKVGARLKKLREDRDLSIGQVVAGCDVTKDSLSRIENGKKDYSVTTLRQIAKGLGMKLADLSNECFKE